MDLFTYVLQKWAHQHNTFQTFYLTPGVFILLVECLYNLGALLSSWTLLVLNEHFKVCCVPPCYLAPLCLKCVVAHTEITGNALTYISHTDTLTDTHTIVSNRIHIFALGLSDKQIIFKGSVWAIAYMMNEYILTYSQLWWQLILIFSEIELNKIVSEKGTSHHKWEIITKTSIADTDVKLGIVLSHCWPNSIALPWCASFVCYCSNV